MRDVASAIGIVKTDTIKSSVDAKYISKINYPESQKLGLRCVQNGVLTISFEGLKDYLLKTNEAPKVQMLLKELETVEINNEVVEILTFAGVEAETQNTIQVLEQREILGHVFKIYGTYENPLFLAKDVAEWIEYSKRSDGSYQVGQMLKSVDEEEKISTVNNLNGKEMWFLTEDGLYEVLMQSRKPIAKEFKKQIKVILKEIRLTGRYVNNSDKFVDNYFSNLSEDVRQAIRKELSNKNQILLAEIKPLEDELEANLKVIDLIDGIERIKEV